MHVVVTAVLTVVLLGGCVSAVTLRHPETGELWGNIPQTYCMAGVISTGMKLSREWDEAWGSSP